MPKNEPRSIISNKKGFNNMNGLENEKDLNGGKIVLNLPEYKFAYVLSGTPQAVAKVPDKGDGSYTPHKHKKLLTTIEISAQHNERPFFQGPLQLDIFFFFPIPQRGERSKVAHHHKYYDIKPSLSDCVAFVENICTSLLFKESATIVSLHSEKRYDRNPRTELYITELK